MYQAGTALRRRAGRTRHQQPDDPDEDSGNVNLRECIEENRAELLQFVGKVPFRFPAAARAAHAGHGGICLGFAIQAFSLQEQTVDRASGSRSQAALPERAPCDGACDRRSAQEHAGPSSFAGLAHVGDDAGFVPSDYPVPPDRQQGTSSCFATPLPPSCLPSPATIR